MTAMQEPTFLILTALATGPILVDPRNRIPDVPLDPFRLFAEAEVTFWQSFRSLLVDRCLA